MTLLELKSGNSDIILNTAKAKADHIISRLLADGLINDDGRHEVIDELVKLLSSDEEEFNAILDQVSLRLIRVRNEEGERFRRDFPMAFRQRYGEFCRKVSRPSDMPSEPPPAMG